LYLWGKLKSVEYANNPHDLEAREQNICEAVYNIQQRELQQVTRNLFKRIQTCLTAEGRHFASCSGCAAAFFSASDAALSQEAADSKINVQSTCTLNTV
jgi:hypothetical protein